MGCCGSMLYCVGVHLLRMRLLVRVCISTMHLICFCEVQLKGLSAVTFVFVPAFRFLIILEFQSHKFVSCKFNLRPHSQLVVQTAL